MILTLGASLPFLAPRVTEKILLPSLELAWNNGLSAIADLDTSSRWGEGTLHAQYVKTNMNLSEGKEQPCGLL